MGISINVFAIENFSEIEAPDSFFGSPAEIIDAILNNELSLDGETIFENLLKLIGEAVKNVLPYLSSLLAVAILLSIVEKLKIISPSCESAAIIGGKIIFSVLLVNSSMLYIESAKVSLQNISQFTQALLPIIVTFLMTLGASGTVTVLGPSQMLLSSVLINIGTNVIFPLIIVGFIAAAVNGILNDNKLRGIFDFIKSIVAWITGGIFTVFSAVIALQGVVSSVTDGISIKSIKYALSSSVPIIGSTISESFSTVLLSAFSIKSAAGIMGIIIILGIVLSPIINMWVYVMVLNCFGAVVEPFAGAFVTEQIRNVTDFLKLALIVLLGVSVLWFIYLGAIVSAGGNLI